MKRALIFGLLCAACVHLPTGGDDDATISLGGTSFTLAELKRQLPTETIRGFDPYYQREKAFLTLPLEALLRLRWPGLDLAKQDFVLRASDGYTVPAEAGRLLEGAYLAYADADGAWEPIGAKRVNPGPWYLVWKDHRDLTTHPRPWALASIDAESFEAVFPLLVPRSGDANVQRGFALFREHCVKCHALNQQGGRVGPELNVPKNVTEYRDDAFLREWIKNPLAFRISVMPPSPQLSDDDLSALLAYLRAMKQSKVEVPTGAAHL